MEKPGLSRRERQIMDALYTLGEATVGEVMDRMPDPPSYSAVRATLRVLEEKGHAKHKQDGPRYLYLPTVSRDKAQSTALKHLVGTFFGGSVEQAVMALLSMPETKMSDDQLEKLAEQVRRAEEEGR
ncbi:MAG TPA: BlaI/MecI/CopY family transcriptional regulator [Longimicrobiales bacterium]|jgi:BlaI family penicillinase repressor